MSLSHVILISRVWFALKKIVRVMCWMPFYAIPRLKVLHEQKYKTVRYIARFRVVKLNIDWDTIINSMTFSLLCFSSKNARWTWSIFANEILFFHWDFTFGYNFFSSSQKWASNVSCGQNPLKTARYQLNESNEKLCLPLIFYAFIWSNLSCSFVARWKFLT